MSDTAQQYHSKILGFLAGEFARKDGRQCVGVDLLFSPGGGFKDEPIRSWERADEPDKFDDFGSTEGLATQLLEIAEGEADAKPPGRHRFVIRTRQHLGGRAVCSISLNPAFNGNADEVSLVSSREGSGSGGGSARPEVIANHASQLMRINAQMFDGALRVFGQQQTHLLGEVTELRAQNLALQRELEAAKANNMEREFQIHIASEKNNRANAGFQKLLEIGTVVAAKIGAGDDPSSGGSASSLGMLITTFGKSLSGEQVNELMSRLTVTQRMMFGEIMQMAQQSKPPAGAGGANGSNGAPKAG